MSPKTLPQSETQFTPRQAHTVLIAHGTPLQGKKTFPIARSCYPDFYVSTPFIGSDHPGSDVTINAFHVYTYSRKTDLWFFARL